MTLYRVLIRTCDDGCTGTAAIFSLEQAAADLAAGLHGEVESIEVDPPVRTRYSAVGLRGQGPRISTFPSIGGAGLLPGFVWAVKGEAAGGATAYGWSEAEAVAAWRALLGEPAK